MASTEALIERRNKILGRAYRLFYERPLHIVKGEGVWLTGADGTRYLDAYNNVPHVGHCHPHVVEAICRQAQILNTHTRYLHETILDYSEKYAAQLHKAIDTLAQRGHRSVHGCRTGAGSRKPRSGPGGGLGCG